MTSRYPVLSFILTTMLTFFASSLVAEEVVLEDYQGGGVFEPADWGNSFEDAKGNVNKAAVEGGVAVVDWATKWSGQPSSGTAQDFSKLKTFQVDVMVAKDQPVQTGSNFYFQLTNETDQGFSYWELFVPQEKIPADGKWYRVQFPMSRMDKGHGEGGELPTDFKTVHGTVCGMTYDDEVDQYTMKQASFDNVTLADKPVEEITITVIPKK